MDEDLTSDCTKATTAPEVPDSALDDMSTGPNFSALVAENDCTKATTAPEVPDSALDDMSHRAGLSDFVVENEIVTSPDGYQRPATLDLIEDLANIQRLIYDPTVLTFCSTLNRLLPPVGRKRQETLAISIGVVTSALSHYRAGRRTPAIGIVRSLARELNLSVEQEALLTSAWFFDQDIYSLRAYFDSIVRDKAFDRLPLVVERLQRLNNMYFTSSRR